jgi:hypothetical protein
MLALRESKSLNTDMGVEESTNLEEDPKDNASRVILPDDLPAREDAFGPHTRIAKSINIIPRHVRAAAKYRQTYCNNKYDQTTNTSLYCKLRH